MVGKHRISNSISERVWLQTQKDCWIDFRDKFVTEFFGTDWGGKSITKTWFSCLKKASLHLARVVFWHKNLHALRLWLFLLADIDHIFLFAKFFFCSYFCFVVCISIFLFKVEFSVIIRLFLFLLLMKNKNHKKTYWYKEVYLLGGN